MMSLALWALAGYAAGAQGTLPPRVLESFNSVAAFRAVPSDGVSLALRADSGVVGRALRLDFDFQGHAGYAVARRAFTLPALPSHWALTLWVRGEARPNTLELKLVDSTGTNVWWLRRPELLVTRGWTRLRFRATDLSFAWGPRGGGPPSGIAALELAITAGAGGRGWVAFDDLVLLPLDAPVDERRRPDLSASSARRDQPAASALPVDFADAPTSPRLYGDRVGWHSAQDGRQWLALDCHGARQLSGIALAWSTRDWPRDYDVEVSDDGRRWTVLRQVRDGAGGRRYLHLPRTETRWLRLALLRSSRGEGYGLDALHLLSDSAASTRTAFLERVAEGSAHGLFPRSLTGRQSYWTVVGIPHDARDALMGEDGGIESRPGSFSLEPFLLVGAHRLGWSDGTVAQSLDGGWRPIPTARRTTPTLVLATTAFVSGAPGRSVLWVRYRVVNRTSRPVNATLVAAVRPIQVNPPLQFLGIAGGAARITALEARDGALVVNDSDRIVAVTPGAQLGLATFDAGGLVTLLDSSQTSDAPLARRITDSTGLAEGVLRWTVRPGPRDSVDVWVALPAPRPDSLSTPDASRASDPIDVDSAVARRAEVRALWDGETAGMQLQLPAAGTDLANTLRSALAYILVNANDSAIQPGTRSYRRSWIRDGALTSSALLRLGHASEARGFLEWYLPYVFPDGKVPCCVDARGADPVTENDADGELLYLAAEYLRITGDSGVVRRHWSTLLRVASHLDSLRRSRRTPQYLTPDSLLVFGLLPPSISHEGYSAKPAYSYWDDWWGVRGLDDAALLARVAGDAEAVSRFVAAGGEMRADVVASVARAMARFHLATLPGAADLGDTDPTSSTIALEPAQALGDLPRVAVQATFDSAWATLQRRINVTTSWEVFVPYEWRNVGALLRLGEPERAQRYADWLMGMRRPAAWNEWSEAIWRDARAPHFIGDMPHGWVHSDFIRAAVDRFAYERASDSVLVVGAGIPVAWARDRAGITVQGLRTWWGALVLRVEPEGGSTVRVTVGGVHPPNGIELRAPFGATPRAVTVDGEPASLRDGGREVLLRGPATVEFRY